MIWKEVGKPTELEIISSKSGIEIKRKSGGASSHWKFKNKNQMKKALGSLDNLL